ncbi:MAG: nitroreductase family protein [Candidatus Absconditabacteria bacterium]|nr:nitroreductase family protein [Candidatus Absconditabacteria bacterium]MDD3867985.1 nitroreductase family protein [Candidatus Absconditabacteria bacterium]MDD4714232.1 nitroreductase family protein [Candidatus Absconditabacteria bacterium]
MTRTFKEALLHRRSYYNIDDQVIVSPEKIKEIVETAVKHSPSAFNSQTARVVILLGEHHKKFWQIVKDTLLAKIGAERFADSEQRINASFLAGYGTLLFYEDQSIIRNLEENFPSFRDNFQTWSQQSSGIQQFVAWTMLEDAGLGASLQHYNPLIDQETAETWDINPDWKLLAQMPFGNPVATPGEKEFGPIEERVKLFA